MRNILIKIFDGLDTISYFLFFGYALMKEMFDALVQVGFIEFIRGFLREFHNLMIELQVMRTDGDWDYSKVK